MEDLDTVVQGKIDGDTEFLSSLAELSDEDKSAKVEEKRKELTKVVWKETLEAKTKAEKIAEDQKGRAIKAEAKAKESKPNEEIVLTPKDTVALMNAKVETEDIDEVVNWANFKKVPVAEAIKDPTLKTILAQRVEQRTTAQVTITKGGQHGASKETGEQILNKARTGQLPETDADMEKLTEARIASKLKK